MHRPSCSGVAWPIIVLKHSAVMCPCFLAGWGSCQEQWGRRRPQRGGRSGRAATAGDALGEMSRSAWRGWRPRRPRGGKLPVLRSTTWSNRHLCSTRPGAAGGGCILLFRGRGRNRGRMLQSTAEWPAGDAGSFDSRTGMVLERRAALYTRSLCGLRKNSETFPSPCRFPLLTLPLPASPPPPPASFFGSRKNRSALAPARGAGMRRSRPRGGRCRSAGSSTAHTKRTHAVIIFLAGATPSS